MDARIKAIREDKLVGRNTCAMVDECMTDDELIEELNEYGIVDPVKAVEHARGMQRDYLSQACECRWGEDSDPQLVALEAFDKAMKEEPICS